jgi:hypothetical protein
VGNPKRTKPQAVPDRARGRGHPTQKQSYIAPGRGARRTKASTGDVDARYDDNIDLSPFELVVVPIKPPTRASNDSSPLDFNARENNIKPLRFQDPSKPNKTCHGDSCFWKSYQAYWYETVIRTKNCITIEMKWVNWDYLKSILAPCNEAMDVVYDRCHEMGLLNIMNFSCDWNDEVVAQFYATLYVDDRKDVMHFTLGGKRFSIKMYEFASLFCLGGVKEIIYQGRSILEFDRDFVRLHDGNELEVSKMHFMYDKAYRKVHFGHAKGLSPFYKMLNQLFRFALIPRGGDSENISHWARNLL